MMNFVKDVSNFFEVVKKIITVINILKRVIKNKLFINNKK